MPRSTRAWTSQPGGPTTWVGASGVVTPCCRSGPTGAWAVGRGVAVGHAKQVTYYNTMPQGTQETVSHSAPAGSATSRGRWLDDVCRKVRHYWVDEVLHRSLEHTVRVELSLAE